MKKGFTVFLLAALLLSVGLITLAGCENNTPYIERGIGTQENPHIIGSKQQLIRFADAVNGGETYYGIYFVLGANINLSDEEWTPIGINPDKCFAGHFDGKGRKITNFKITSVPLVE